MCTAITYKTNNFYFGRTLDNEFSFGEKITLTPRNFPFTFTNGTKICSHHALIGMAYVTDNYPLYFDAMNEKGLCVAGLNFAGNAFFNKEKPNYDNIAVYEFIPWILCQCENIKEVIRLLEKINLTDTPFNEKLPAAELHWLIADKTEAITVECMQDGLHISRNDIGILTNNPPFDFQMHNLNNFLNLSPETPCNNFSEKHNFSVYSKGMGAIGLPGDWSSQSRFVKSAFLKLNSVTDNDEESSVNQFFHILGSVSLPCGCTVTPEGKEITVYTSCMNADKGIYYVTTYENHQISAADMNKEDLDSDRLISYPLTKSEQIKTLN